MSNGPGNEGIVECPDGHRCENGSLCVENPYDEGNYYCDCDAAFLDSAYQGLYCEHEATEYCSYKGAVSRNSFCTNGGTCVAKVGEDEAHLGCICPDDYEGNNCQFVKGTRPEGWPYTTETATNPNASTRSGGGGGMGGGAIAGIVIVVLAVVIAAIFFVYRAQIRKRGHGQAIDTAGSESPRKKPVTEDNLDADGGMLQKPSDAEGEFQIGVEETQMVEEESEII
uniref:EGF-like domain-containing protein n=1 Tax=Pseudictyota dubia TaxID=2749911 RepID=A0A7R9VHK7_9STRA|mmetsp:Transcript_14635/g.27965  ORF Transcript_14635/g.27965 Transcript_14635/m.27965 type:complete len:226 (+) Transcript_14635:262-939(+)|eukprot:CAMPEP_0197438260 /NCGR_PEP_ID=MMETSP1175-20131217/5301_1 /TAXON_ID=1003142 /ORGANISM="Triceratium dubium, Strain CCMP147" /LENGTH=225 /DNA_ID=CAMNT_0042967951 /DNA_START=207 /DNA_END=884 /DNA_ORIENTATION=+